jgi:DnaJ-class molecular chaperone
MEETRELVKTECPKCEGRGLVWCPSYDEYACSHNFYDEKDCPDCSGLGFIYKPKEE